MTLNKERINNIIKNLKMYEIRFISDYAEEEREYIHELARMGAGKRSGFTIDFNSDYTKFRKINYEEINYEDLKPKK